MRKTVRKLVLLFPDDSAVYGGIALLEHEILDPATFEQCLDMRLYALRERLIEERAEKLRLRRLNA